MLFMFHILTAKVIVCQVIKENMSEERNAYLLVVELLIHLIHVTKNDK